MITELTPVYDGRKSFYGNLHGGAMYRLTD
mgnify:CR=1 FL=1